MTAGEGTERSEEFLSSAFGLPCYSGRQGQYKKKGALEAFFSTADSGKPCILVGTQMLAKGIILKMSH